MKMDVLSLVDLIWWWWSSCGSTQRNITQQLCPGFCTQRSVKGMTDSSRVTDSLCSHAQLNGAVGASCWCSVSVSVYMQQRKQKKWRVSSPSSGVCVGSAGSYDPVLLTSLSPGYKQLHKLHKFSTTVPDQTRQSLSLSLSSFYRTHLSLVALWNALTLHWRRGLFFTGPVLAASLLHFVPSCGACAHILSSFRATEAYTCWRKSFSNHIIWVS